MGDGSWSLGAAPATGALLPLLAAPRLPATAAAATSSRGRELGVVEGEQQLTGRGVSRGRGGLSAPAGKRLLPPAAEGLVLVLLRSFRKTDMVVAVMNVGRAAAAVRPGSPPSTAAVAPCTALVAAKLLLQLMARVLLNVERSAA